MQQSSLSPICVASACQPFQHNFEIRMGSSYYGTLSYSFYTILKKTKWWDKARFPRIWKRPKSLSSKQTPMIESSYPLWAVKEDILLHIQNNREVSRIYSELKAGFPAYDRVTPPRIREEDRGEIHNDSFIDLTDNISSEELQQLTCSLQTYVNTMDYSKSVDLLRKKSSTQSLPDYERIESDNDFDIADDASDAIAIGHQEETYELAKDIEDDAYRIILFSSYWRHYSMEILVELTGLSNVDVAKSTKVRCFTRLRNTVLTAFRKKGLI